MHIFLFFFYFFFSSRRRHTICALVTGVQTCALPISNWLAGASDQNTGLFVTTPGTSKLEQVALKWLLDVLDLPKECAGAFVTEIGRASCRERVCPYV